MGDFTRAERDYIRDKNISRCERISAYRAIKSSPNMYAALLENGYGLIVGRMSLDEFCRPECLGFVSRHIYLVALFVLGMMSLPLVLLGFEHADDVFYLENIVLIGVFVLAPLVFGTAYRLRMPMSFLTPEEFKRYHEVRNEQDRRLYDERFGVERTRQVQARNV